MSPQLVAIDDVQTPPAAVGVIACTENVALVSSQVTTNAINPQKKPGFNYPVNAFRGVCVLLVFFYHVSNSGLLHGGVPTTFIGTAIKLFAESWRYGVELFFMISGFVIVASLRRHRNVSVFLRDRCIRIFPVWIPVHVGLFAIGALTGWKIFHDLNGSQLLLVFFSNLLLIPPLLPIPVTHPASWSLSYEWLFYFVAAAAFALATARKTSTTVHAMWWTVWSVVTISLLCLMPRALFFLPGVIVACGGSSSRWSASFRWPLLSMVAFLFAWRMVGLDRAEPAAYSIIEILASIKLLYALVAFAAGLHLFSCVSQNGNNIAWLRGRGIQFLGTVSYSFYLWHPIVMFGVKKVITTRIQPTAGGVLETVIFAVVSFGLALAISWLSYRFIEQGLAKALRRMFGQRTTINAVNATSFATAFPARMEGG